MSTASRGRALEHEIREIFRQNGYSVIRGAGSKGDFARFSSDLVASRVTVETERKVYLVVILAQCKLKGRKKKEEQTIDDGFGSTWSKRCPECGKLSMEIVRPGKVQCSNCG